MSTLQPAAFDPTHVQERVDEAFACPVCDSGQAGIPRLVAMKQRWSHQTLAHCRCTACDHRWALRLDLAQTLRITQIASPGVPDGFPVDDPFGVH